MSLPPQEIPLGAMRFNSDSQKLEYWNGSAWFQIHTVSPNLDGGARGLFGGGATPSNSDVIDEVYNNMATSGNATDYGDLTDQTIFNIWCCIKSSWCFDGGFLLLFTDIIDFVTISSTGSATDFGNLSQIHGGAGCGNSTRGLFGGGNPETSST